MRGRRCIRTIPMLEICEDRIALDGAAGAGVQDEGPVATMQDPAKSGGSGDGEFDFTPDPAPSVGYGENNWVDYWAEYVAIQEDALTDAAPTQATPAPKAVSPF